MKNIFLKQKLRRLGATRSDAKTLAAIADKLATTLPGLDPTAKKRIASEIGFKPHYHVTRYRLALGSGFAALAVLVIVAQSALPGSPLYALKRGSEEVRTVVQPGFSHDDIKQRREDEQKKVIQKQQLKDERSGKTESTPEEGTKNTTMEESSETGQKTEEQKSDNSGRGSVQGASDNSASDNNSSDSSSGGSGRSHSDGSED